MLRITLHEKPGAITIQFEGALCGPWVHEASKCWQRIRADDQSLAIQVDLMGVTSVDMAGRRLLTAMHTGRAKLVACGCMMRAIVAEITGVPAAEFKCAESRGQGDAREAEESKFVDHQR